MDTLFKVTETLEEFLTPYGVLKLLLSLLKTVFMLIFVWHKSLFTLHLNSNYPKN